MTAEVVWLDSAERDLKEVYRYILEDRPHAAVRYIKDIIDAIGRLAHFRSPRGAIIRSTGSSWCATTSSSIASMLTADGSSFPQSWTDGGTSRR